MDSAVRSPLESDSECPRRFGGGRARVVVIGAGAAGLTAAIFAARAGADVVVLETRPKPGAKIRISGGGRCNVLPSVASPEDFFTSGSPVAIRNVLGSWPLAEVRAFFEGDLGVALVDEAGGKVFPATGRSRDIVDAILRAATEAGVRVEAGARVAELEAGPPWSLRLERGDSLSADRVILATGGRSLPRTGSDGAGVRFAEALGHRPVPPRPALVPLLDSSGAWTDLAGLSVPVTLTVREGREGRDGRHAREGSGAVEGALLDERSGSLLFTHGGFSGPVILDVSRHFTRPDPSGSPGRASGIGGPDPSGRTGPRS